MYLQSQYLCYCIILRMHSCEFWNCCTVYWQVFINRSSRCLSVLLWTLIIFNVVLCLMMPIAGLQQSCRNHVHISASLNWCRRNSLEYRVSSCCIILKLSSSFFIVKITIWLLRSRLQISSMMQRIVKNWLIVLCCTMRWTAGTCNLSYRWTYNVELLKTFMRLISFKFLRNS